MAALVSGLAAAALASCALAEMTTGRPGYGLIGYGIQMYDPPCAYACHDSITAPLNCTDAEMGDGDMSGMVMRRMAGMGDDGGSGSDLPSGNGWMVMSPTPACLANNDFYLQTLAFCMKSHCNGVPVDQLESFWALNVAGRSVDQPLPKISYQQALADITATPTRELNNSEFLNYTAVVPYDLWSISYISDTNFEAVEITHEKYALVVFLGGVMIPIGFSLLRFLPWPTSWVTKFNGYVVDPPVFGSRHASPLLGLGIVPTRGQAFFIAYFWILNIILCSVGYNPSGPNAWYDSLTSQLLAYSANRFGVLSFANLPLLVIYASRNNVVMWLSDWSHNTFLIIHRWIAFICMLQAALHSALYLRIHTMGAENDHATESKLPYWYWGIIATLALVVLIPASVQPLRQRAYKYFLASHIALSMLALIGCFLHIYFRFVQQWGYEVWIYMAVALWVFDRLVRAARSLRHGIKRAYVTPVDDDYYRVDVSGVSASGHVYLHFFTLNPWRFWESNPFSVAGVTHGRSPAPSSRPASVEEKAPVTSTAQTIESERSSDSPSRQVGATSAGSTSTTFFIRRTEKGLTSLLPTKGQIPSGLPVLVEASYGSGASFLQNGDIHPTSEFPNVLFIAGGVGITVVLPMLDKVSSVGPSLGRKKVYWGVRTIPLVHAVEEMLGYSSKDSGEKRRWGDVDIVLSVGDRMDVRGVLESELSSQEGGTTVVACGPAGMADEVRCVVAGLARHGVVARLIVESFAW